MVVRMVGFAMKGGDLGAVYIYMKKHSPHTFFTQKAMYNFDNGNNNYSLPLCFSLQVWVPYQGNLRVTWSILVVPWIKLLWREIPPSDTNDASTLHILLPDVAIIGDWDIYHHHLLLPVVDDQDIGLISQHHLISPDLDVLHLNLGLSS